MWLAVEDPPTHTHTHTRTHSMQRAIHQNLHIEVLKQTPTFICFGCVAISTFVLADHSHMCRRSPFITYLINGAQ